MSGYYGSSCVRSAIQLGTKHHLTGLLARALKPADSSINVPCREPTVTELLCCIHYSSNDTISLLLCPVSLQKVDDS